MEGFSMHGWWNWIFCIEVCFRDVAGWDARRIRAFVLRSWNGSIAAHYHAELDCSLSWWWTWRSRCCWFWLFELFRGLHAILICIVRLLCLTWCSFALALLLAFYARLMRGAFECFAVRSATCRFAFVDLILEWISSAFVRFLCQVFSFVFIDEWYDEWWTIAMSKRMCVCWYACMSVAIPEWLSLRVAGHVSRNRVSSRMLLRVSHVWIRVSVCGDDDDHDDYNTCIVEGGCMWPRVCRASMWSVFAFTFVRIAMHANAWTICLCLICFTSHRIWTFACFALHCSWNAARDCEDMATMAAVCENILKFYSNSISVHILRLSNTPPLFFAKSFPFVVLNVGCLFAFVMRLNNIFEFTGNDCN